MWNEESWLSLFFMSDRYVAPLQGAVVVRVSFSRVFPWTGM